MIEELQALLESRGIKDFDELREDEKKTYLEMLQMVESAKITLDDYRRFVKALRQSVENELANYRPGFLRRWWDGDKDSMLKARLKNLILFESFFDRPDKAKEILSRYKAKK